MLFLFLLVNLFNIGLFFTKRYNVFLLASMVIIFVEPVFQKLTDVTLLGDTYNVFGFDRVKTNLILIASFFAILLFQRRTLVRHTVTQPLHRYIFVVIAFHLFNVLLSENITSSVILATVSIIGPVLFFYIILGMPAKMFSDNKNLLRVLYFSVIWFLTLGIVMYNNTISKSQGTGDVSMTRVAGGLWLSNISTQTLAMFFPFAFSRVKFQYSKTIRAIVIMLFVLLLVISMSRTGLVVYGIMLLIIFRKSRSKVIYILIGVPSLLLLLNFANSILQVNVVDAYSQRFFEEGDAISTTENDSRFEIYKEGLEIVKGHEIMGTGISTFVDLNSGGFSNAHNIFVNIYVERGIIGISLFGIFLYYIFSTNLKLLREYKTKYEEEYEFFKFIQIGIIGFLLIGLTGNDLFINSGFVNGWATYIILLLLGIQIKKQEFLRKQKTIDIDTQSA